MTVTFEYTIDGRGLCRTVSGLVAADNEGLGGPILGPSGVLVLGGISCEPPWKKNRGDNGDSGIGDGTLAPVRWNNESMGRRGVPPWKLVGVPPEIFLWGEGERRRVTPRFPETRRRAAGGAVTVAGRRLVGRASGPTGMLIFLRRVNCSIPCSFAKVMLCSR
jgi:hypothetical protein